MSDQAFDIQFIQCAKTPMRLTPNGCGRLWASAHASKPEPYEGRSLCFGCQVGAANAGHPAVEAINDAASDYWGAACARCLKVTDRLVNNEFCKSCYNRQREAERGRFAAWASQNDKQRAMWPGVIELTGEFYESLAEYAVPLDPRALAALKHSALALDVYSWLSHRLHRVRGPNGTKLSWSNLREQFGQEYRDPKDFKRELMKALGSVLAVYPDARIEKVPGGLTLLPSKPPVPKTGVQVRLPSPS